jgi:ribosomal protein S21
MAVIVSNDNTPIDQALRMLWRESNREQIIDKLKELRYYIKPTTKRHLIKKVWAKTKKRRARVKRKFQNKGYMP